MNAVGQSRQESHTVTSTLPHVPDPIPTLVYLEITAITITIFALGQRLYAPAKMGPASRNWAENEQKTAEIPVGTCKPPAGQCYGRAPARRANMRPRRTVTEW
ncbi:hypothetical protein DL546_007515 [Coniochaeta pulveracea]|uniref:Uncharacterized protein n=1 Tax=Coniochaeta pulveracea TaxID=177199 RepID=A0A420Y9G2_9PEZI|nr:hypothetical protein DL546_007515 [Coniochaeta pulveracea]